MPIINVQTGEVTYSAEELAAQAAPILPSVISPRQCRLMLLQMNMLQTVEDMITQQDQATKIAWEYATEFRRDHPLLLALAANLQLDSAALDNFFIGASVL